MTHLVSDGVSKESSDEDRSEDIEHRQEWVQS